MYSFPEHSDFMYVVHTEQRLTTATRFLRDIRRRGVKVHFDNGRNDIGFNAVQAPELMNDLKLILCEYSAEVKAILTGQYPDDDDKLFGRIETENKKLQKIKTKLKRFTPENEEEEQFLAEAKKFIEGPFIHLALNHGWNASKLFGALKKDRKAVGLIPAIVRSASRRKLTVVSIDETVVTLLDGKSKKLVCFKYPTIELRPFWSGRPSSEQKKTAQPID